MYSFDCPFNAFPSLSTGSANFNTGESNVHSTLLNSPLASFDPKDTVTFLLSSLTSNFVIHPSFTTSSNHW